MKCLRCDQYIQTTQKALVNNDGEFAHDDCIGWDDLNEGWVVVDKWKVLKDELSDLLKMAQRECEKDLEELITDIQYTMYLLEKTYR